MSVAGYVWPFEKWKLFQRQWRRMLRDNDLKFFHMTDFETFNGVYKGWTRRRHDSVIKRVIRIITASRPYGVGAAVKLDDYAALAPEDKTLIGSPYALCASWCMGLMATWLEGQRIPGPGAYIFEQGDTIHADLRAEIVKLTASRTFREKLRVLSLTFGEKQTFPSLQAADVLAYELCKQVARNIGIETRPTRKSLLALIENAWHDRGVFFDAAGLARNLEGARSQGDAADILRRQVMRELRQARAARKPT